MINIFIIALQIKNLSLPCTCQYEIFDRSIYLLDNIKIAPLRELTVLPLERTVGEFAYRNNRCSENHVGHTNTPCEKC